LSIDGDRSPPGELTEGDAVPPIFEAKFDSMVDKALLLEPVANPGSSQEIHGALFEHARTNSFLNIFARPAFQDD